MALNLKEEIDTLQTKVVRKTETTFEYVTRRLKESNKAQAVCNFAKTVWSGIQIGFEYICDKATQIPTYIENMQKPKQQENKKIDKEVTYSIPESEFIEDTEKSQPEELLNKKCNDEQVPDDVTDIFEQSDISDISDQSM